MTYLSSVTVVERVFDHQPFEHLDGNLTDVPLLLESPTHLPQQQAHQEVVSAEVVSQRVIQLQICSKRKGHQL